MAPVTMKDDALPQIHLVRDTDLGVFAYELHTRNRFSHGRVEKGERHTLAENMERSFMPY